jgi:inner membrane protein
LPSPIAHALGAAATGWSLSRPHASRRDAWRQAAILAALGMAPDLDLLVGRHSQETHSVGFAVIVASVAAWRRWPIAVTPARIWIVAFAAWFSHSLFDASSVDLGPPIGVMMFWPFSFDYWHTGVNLFGAIERHWDHPGFWRQNITSFARELVVLVPVAAGIWWTRKRH